MIGSSAFTAELFQMSHLHVHLLQRKVVVTPIREVPLALLYEGHFCLSLES